MTDSCLTFKDTRSEKKRNDLKKEKWDRNIKENNGIVPKKKSTKKDSNGNKKETVESESDIDEPLKKVIDDKYNDDLIANPTNIHRRYRSESPPPKSKRTNDGINRGKPSACSHCRPEIHSRMSNTSVVRSEIRKLNSTDPKLDNGSDVSESESEEEVNDKNEKNNEKSV